MMDSRLRLAHVSRTFGDHGEKVEAVRDVSFTVPENSMWVIAGPSGSGKTTLLNLAGGMDRPTSGDIHVGEFDLNVLDEHGLSLFRRSHVGFIFQGYNLIPTLSAYENIELPLLLNGEETGDKVSAMIEDIGLSHRARAFPNTLSGGEQQRVAIARALVHSPSIVLADEPTANLDSKTALDVFDLLIELNKKMRSTILFATHDPMIIERADNVLKLSDGRLV
jgi:putative ABC transport system ATP-binding protein